ncbi:XkdF-like putative serine protease domain-containing protein [Natrinema halophilum]|uniref:Phage-like element PBSX protein XkdF domain-containing protein n=1 Tax=Natrinema halophilum TaxID=1699371 RepID=A0A7D5KWR5_9EURY|nr:XkdF-like putative serine protease domain-containing protein [Natrinema halophilum]QLG47902.1 XkdF-like putative serine protease domain-containing protein [Natrinema halophilum]
MPPVTKAGGEQFRKDVAFVTKDDDEQIAAGIVMVPDKADLQNDFAREETIRGFADQFEAFVEAGEAGGGIMHAVFPDGWMELERNEVLEENEEIGGQTVDAGAWVQEWRIENADLWELIADGILEGYSIGAIQVDWNGPFDQDEVDDVAVPDDLGEDPLIWELTDGIIREVSAVDIPAVPDAQILETKDAAEKRLGDYLGDPDGFVEEAQQRGHSEVEAERLWDVLNEAVTVDGSAEPGEKSIFHRIGKAAVDTFLGADDSGTDSRKADSGEAECWVCGDEATFQNEDPPNELLCDEHADPQGDRATELSVSTKEGRTLSTSNRDSLFATIDSSLDVLQDAGVDHGMTRFTDREDTAFDLTEHSAREWSNPDDDEDEETDVSPVNNAAGGDTPDDTDNTTDMTDDNPDDPMGDAPEWAKALDDRIDDLETDKDADGEADDPLKDAPEWAKNLTQRVDEIEEKALDGDGEEEKPEWAKDLEARIDRISEQSGVSTQLERSADGESDEDDSGLGGLGKALS